MKCKYCGGTEWYGGPSGGLSMNIRCANEKCRHWFNSTPFGLDDLERVEPTQDERERAREEDRRMMDDAAKARRAEGIAIYHSGKPASACVVERRGTVDYSLDRLCGYVAAMREDLRR